VSLPLNQSPFALRVLLELEEHLAFTLWCLFRLLELGSVGLDFLAVNKLVALKCLVQGLNSQKAQPHSQGNINSCTGEYQELYILRGS
jgi:hypothetical protein